MKNLTFGRSVSMAVIATIVLVMLNSYQTERPEPLSVGEVPIAFWAWRAETPTSAEIQQTFAATGAETLFLHIGQFDVVDGSVRRVRTVRGEMPPSVEMQLVYNGTRRFLSEWDKLEPQAIVDVIADTYRADLQRAHGDHASVDGIQLDLDIPTRLLPKYALVLDGVRKLLPAGTKLSITGLPTWIGSNDLKSVLSTVDFWIPQCYGTDLPRTLIQDTPISSAADVARTINSLRRLGKPFYAGLAAYGYAILYRSDGHLEELRGDIGPEIATGNPGLELIETRARNTPGEEGGTARVYRAKKDVIVNDLIIRPGEWLVFDMPSLTSLRATARAVRENAGDSLLGICVFRLPTAGDKTNLNTQEIAVALSDKPLRAATGLSFRTLREGTLELVAENTGTAQSNSENALTVDLYVSADVIKDVTITDGFTAFEMLCRQVETGIARPCSSRRSNMIRLTSRSWGPGLKAAAILSYKGPLPDSFTTLISTRLDDNTCQQEFVSLQPTK